MGPRSWRGKSFSAGDYTQTKNQLDLAVEGKGFFKLLNNGKEVTPGPGFQNG